MTIRSCLEKLAKETPHSAALKYCRCKEWHTRTWAEFLSGVRAVAEAYGPAFALRPREEAVAIMLPNTPEWMEAYLACSGAGVAVVPIDPKLHNDEVAYILRDSRAAVVTTDKSHLEMMKAIAPDLPDLRAVVLTDGADACLDPIGGVAVCDYEAIKAAPATKARSEGPDAWYAANVASEEDVASVIYTSGTTGRPKGAMLTHGNFIADIDGGLQALGERVDSTDSLLVVLPLFHAFSFCTNFVLGLFRGCTMMFVRSLYTIGEDVKLLAPSVVMSVRPLSHLSVGKSSTFKMVPEPLRSTSLPS